MYEVRTSSKVKMQSFQKKKGGKKCCLLCIIYRTHQYKVRTIRFLKQFSIRIVPHVVDCTLGGHECANPRGGAPAPDVLSLDWARRRRPWCASVVSRTAGREGRVWTGQGVAAAS